VAGSDEGRGFDNADDVVRITLIPELASVPRARRAAAAAVEAWRLTDLVQDAQLVVSELVTNAVLHAGTTIELVVRRSGDRIRVEVRDANPLLPVIRSHRPDAGTGRGLVMVAQLASAWSVEATRGGKVVWAELVRDSDSMRVGAPGEAKG
jgi:anti-sigma regulatory factor (Ser/Thr protein kinase)